MENSSSGAGSTVGAAGESATIPHSTETLTTSIGSSASEKVSSPNTPQDDPEWDFGDGKKYKRSEALKRTKDLEKGMYKAHERAAAQTKKYEAISGALSKFGVSVEEFLSNPDEHFSKAAQQLISKQVEESLMDPKELQFQKEKEELAKEKEEIRKFKEAREAEEAESRTAQLSDQMAEQWVPAMKTSGLPANPKTVARMADVALGALRQGILYNPEEAANYTKSLIQQEAAWHIQNTQDVEGIEKLLGPVLLEQMRQRFLDKARPQQPQVSHRQSQPRSVPQQTKQSPYIGWDEYVKSKRI